MKANPRKSIARFKFLNQYNDLVREGRRMDNGAVKALLRVAAEDPKTTLAPYPRARASRPGRACSAKSPSRRKARISAGTWRISSITTWFLPLGPGGTGKTYLAVAMAVSALLAKQVNRIILARPAVEAGERLGFLPGTLQQKIDPYMRPLYDALYDLLDTDKLETLSR